MLLTIIRVISFLLTLRLRQTNLPITRKYYGNFRARAATRLRDSLRPNASSLATSYDIHANNITASACVKAFGLAVLLDCVICEIPQ